MLKSRFFKKRELYWSNIPQNSNLFYGEYENEKKMGEKKFDLPQRVFEPQIFEQVPNQNLNLEGD